VIGAHPPSLLAANQVAALACARAWGDAETIARHKVLG